MDITSRQSILEISPICHTGVSPRLFLLAVFLLFSGTLLASEGSLKTSLPSAMAGEEPLVTTHPVGQRGGRLVLALKSEPKTLNPVVDIHEDSQAVIWRLMADLMHINRYSQEVEGALAESWTVSEDGRRYTVKLRRGVRFSDGHPFDADDVLFTFAVYLDEKVKSPYRDALIVGGRPIEVRKSDQHTVVFDLAAPYAAGERLFDRLAMLPQHLLEESHGQGRVRDAWPVTAPAAEIAGLGPFRFKQYIPGERCVLERNPYYWKVDKAGQRLPYFEEVVFLFVPDDEAQLVRFQAGDTDIVDRLSAENYLALERSDRGRRFQLLDRGPGLIYNFLFFNLNDLEERGLSEISRRQAWFRQRAFRRAVSLSIDRAGIVRLVFQRRASPLWSHVTPGFKRWVNDEIATPPRSLSAARELLKAAGFGWSSDKKLIDASGQAVEFSIITSSSNQQRMQMATIIQDDLKQLGMSVRIVPLEHGALVDRITRTFEYEACILALGSGDSDPDSQLPLLLSSGGLHLWQVGQDEPATAWEAEIDRLMKAQSIAVDHARRKELFDTVQDVMAENLPIIFLASPHVLAGAKRDIGNFNPAVLDHTTLWNVESLFRRDNQARVAK